MKNDRISLVDYYCHKKQFMLVDQALENGKGKKGKGAISFIC